jgi:hypothetical protein
MADETNPPTGTALTRAALERVLARAAELHSANSDSDEPGAMNEAQLIELGKEVGLSADSLRQALAEERANAALPVERGALATLMDVATVTAARTVRGTPAGVLGSIDAWMQRAEALQVKRRFTDQLVWEARRDLFASLRRTLRIGGRGYDLALGSDVSGIAAAAGPDRTHVRLVANFGEVRSQRLWTGISLAVVALLTGAPLLAMGVPLLLAALPPLFLAPFVLFLTRRQYRATVRRAQVALEQALDRLEFGEQRPASAAQAFLDALVAPPRLPKG